MSHTCRPACSGIRMTILGLFFLFGFCSCLYQYFLITQSKPWSQAQAYCRSKYTDLATVATMEDMKKMIADVRGVSVTAWIGLQDNGFTWAWSTPAGDQPMSLFHSWHNTNPSNPRNQWELCGAQQGGDWCDLLCNLTQPFVCYTMSNSPGSTSPSKNFVYINQAMMWHDAQAYCRQHYIDLASAMTNTEADDIKKVIPSPTATFIGLHRPTWTWWSDGSVHTFDYWIQGRPEGKTGDCAASVIDPANAGRLMEYDCGTGLYFICYNKPPPTTYISRFKLTALQSTLDLNDPAVTGAILKLMEDRVKQTGANANVTWIEQPGEKIFYNGKN